MGQFSRRELTDLSYSAASARSLEPPNSTQWKEFDGEHADHNFENNVQDTRIAEIDGTNAQDIDTDLDIFLHSLDSELGHSNHQLAQTGHAERPDNPELISDAYTSTYNLDGPDVFVALEKEGNAPISVASQCSRAAELITGLSCISNNNTGGTFQSSLQLAQESIDFVAQVIERVSIHDSGSRAALVITTLCHVIMRLALQTYRHLRLQIAEHKDSDTLGSAKVSEMLDTPLMLGMIQIRSAQARRQVFEALIEAESTRAEDVVDTMRERFRAKAEDDGTDVIISAVWTCLLDFGSTEAQKTSTLDPSTRRQRYDV